MADYLVPIYATGDREITVAFEQESDNLFLVVDGQRTGMSLWFHDEAGGVQVSFGGSDGQDWEVAHTLPITGRPVDG